MKNYTKEELELANLATEKMFRSQLHEILTMLVWGAKGDVKKVMEGLIEMGKALK